jgi:hypothetical protein
VLVSRRTTLPAADLSPDLPRFAELTATSSRGFVAFSNVGRSVKSLGHRIRLAMRLTAKSAAGSVARSVGRRMTSRNLLNWSWVLLSVFVLAACAEQVLGRGMQPPVSPRYTLYAVPAAVGLLRGGPHDYTAPMSIAAYFVYNPTGDADQLIKQSLTAEKLDDAGLWLVPGDDKGLIDLTYLSFLLFGPKMQSVLLSVLCLIGLSTALFLVQFRRSVPAMALLVSILAGLYAVLFTFGITDQATSIAEPRFFAAISLVSTIHLMLVMQSRRRLSIGVAALVVLQVALIMFVIHLRSAEFWQIIAIGVFAAVNLAIDRARWRRIALVLGTLAVGFVGLQTTAVNTYNERYLREDVVGRVFWHNLLMGLAINPTFQLKYGIVPLDDVSVTEAVRKSMIDDGRSREAGEIYPSPDYHAGNFRDFHWRRYEDEARALYVKVALQAPLELAKTYLVWAPRVTWDSVRELFGVEPGRSDVPTANAMKTAPLEFRAAHDLFLSLVRSLALCVLAVATLLLTLSSGLPVMYLVTAAILLALSWAPAVLATPAIQYLQLPITIAIGLIYACCISLASRLIRVSLLRQSPR